MPTTEETLTEKRRKQLDGIVAEMEKNKESEEDIHFVVNDFKSKYVKKKAVLENGTSVLEDGVSVRPPSITSPTLRPEEAEAALEDKKPEIEEFNPANLPPAINFSTEMQTASEVALKLSVAKGTDVNDEFTNQLNIIRANSEREAKALKDYMAKSPPTGELTFMDRVREIGSDPIKLIPFLSGAVETAEMFKLFEAAERLDQDIATKGDLLLLKKFSDEGTQDTSFWYEVMDVMAQLPSFAGELLITGGIYTATKKATIKSTTALLKKMLKEGGKELLEKKLSQISVKVVGGIAGATVQTVPAGITRITAGTFKNMMPDIELTEDEQNQIIGSITKQGDNILLAATKALGEQWIETLSEKSGGLFNSVGRAGKEMMIRFGILKSFLKANPKAKVSDFMRGVKRAGYDGIIAEMAEERVGEIGRAAIGLEEYRFPSNRQLLVELVSFSIPGLTIAGVNRAVERKQTKEGLKQTEKEIEEAIPLTEAEKQVKEEPPIEPIAEEVKEEKPEVPAKEKVPIKEEAKPPEEPLEQPVTKKTYEFEAERPEMTEKFDYYTKEVEGETQYFKKEKPKPEKVVSKAPPVVEAPVFKEHITTGKKEQRGKYQVEKTEEGIKILNIDSGKYVQQTKQNQWAIDQYVDANIENLRSGKRAEIPEGARPEDVNRIIAEESKNPEEIAGAWLNSKEAKDPTATTFEEAVYEVARDIDPADFARYTGYKFTGEKRPQTKEAPHLTGRFKKDGLGLDAIEERINEAMGLAEEQIGIEELKTKEEETISKIINFLTSKEFKDYKPDQKTQEEIDLADKFNEITGLELTESTAQKVTDYRSKAEKWADKIDEFTKTLPESGVPFIIAPHLLKFALQTVSKALRAGATLNRAIRLAIIKTKEKMKAGEKFDEKEFKDIVHGRIPEPGQKERKFTKRLLETENISKEIRKGLSKEAKYYVPIKNRITDNEAKAIIEIKGVDIALNDVKNENNELTPATRVTLAENLIYEYNSQADKVEGKESENLYAKAIKVAEFITQYGTKLGQGIQAFHIWSTLSPEAIVTKYRKDLKKQDVELTKSQEKKVRELTKIAQKAPEGFQKNRAIQDLLKYQMNIEGVHWGDVAMSVWYANILSGYSTHLLNFGANMTQTAGELYTSMVYNPKNAPFILKGLYEGYGRGLLEAWSTLKTGYTPINQIKFEVGKAGMPDILESTKFKGGKWNPLNYWKYVRRFMMATDVFSFYGLKEMRAHELAARMARKEKLDEPNTKIWNKVSDILFKDQIKEARSQALSEKLKGLDFKLRVYEILEQSRVQEITEDTNNIAAHGTFNYKLEGSLGLLTSRVAEAVEAINYKGIKPFKFVVPFTRIVSNVANEYLDWSVWGYVRAARGERGLFAGKSQRFTRELTKEERAKNIIKATTGTIALMTIYAMTDDDDGFFEITANGTGDYKKNYELKEQRWMPYSIRIGKKRFSYINTPLAIPFAFIGNIRDNERYKNNFLDNKDLVTKTTITAYNTMRFVTDMTFLRGFSEFMGSFSEKNPALAANYFKRFGKQIIKGFIVPNIVTQTSRRIQELNDMPIKQANTLLESIIRDIPIARKGLKDIINSLGEPVIPNTDRWYGDVEYDPIWDLVSKNEAWIGRLNKGTVIIYDPIKDKMRPVTNDEYYDFSKLRGELIRKKIEKNLPELQTISKFDVKDKISTYKREATSEAKKQLFAPKPKKKFVN